MTFEQQESHQKEGANGLNASTFRLAKFQVPHRREKREVRHMDWIFSKAKHRHGPIGRADSLIGSRLDADLQVEGQESDEILKQLRILSETYRRADVNFLPSLVGWMDSHCLI